LQEIIYIVLILLLIKIAFIDYKQKIIPDVLNLILNFENCKIYIASAAITFAAFLFVAVITDGGIGGGDIKLFTALGFIFGPEMLLIVAVTFSLAAIISIVRVMLKRINIKESIALAPYICLGVCTCLIKIYIS
jgi:leader peptidase (prepilin peptidase)/N-methyltransferase